MSSCSIYTFIVNGFVIGMGSPTHLMNIMNLVGTQVSMCKFVVVSVCLSLSHTPLIPSNLFSSRFGSEEV